MCQKRSQCRVLLFYVVGLVCSTFLNRMARSPRASRSLFVPYPRSPPQFFDDYCFHYQSRFPFRKTSRCVAIDPARLPLHHKVADGNEQTTYDGEKKLSMIAKHRAVSQEVTRQSHNDPNSFVDLFSESLPSANRYSVPTGTSLCCRVLYTRALDICAMRLQVRPHYI